MPSAIAAETLFEKAKRYNLIQFDDFDFKRNCLLIVNCDSDLFLHPSLRSLYKNVDPSEFSLIVFDNSYSTKFNIDIYNNYGFKNILFFNNCIEYIKDLGTSNRTIFQASKCDKQPSVMHCFTVDMMMKILKARGTKNLIIADSDVIFKRNPFDVIDTSYATIGSYNETMHRIDPYFQYLNLELLTIDYFDYNRMLGLSTDDYTKYDTGASFTEDIISKSLPYMIIDIEEYVEHFGGGSWVNFKDRKYAREVDVLGKPRLSYELVWEWLKSNQKYL